jgi:exosortase J
MSEQADVLSTTPTEMAPEVKSDQPAVVFAVWCGIAILAMAGCLGIYRELLVLWGFWTTDPLRSIGVLIPPASVVLTLRVWRRERWELRGTWWGIPVIAVAYILSWIRLNAMLAAVAGRVAVSFIPTSLPLYLYASGVVLLFAGTRVWRWAWFPLALLMLSQPVPILSNGLIDIPLQNISASVARHFATMIGLVPTTPQLRLMFSPDFGMFIAPGCDGIRGAVTMGYVALILGYLKRVSVYRWAAYVFGAIFLGYLFNFIRLCVLVLYYRAALGHPRLEDVAKQADYVIGSSLFLVATFLFLWLARREQPNPVPQPPREPSKSAPRERSLYGKCAALAILLVATLSLPSSAARYSRKAAPTPESLGARMPRQVGDFALGRTWYEVQNGVIVVESGAYSRPGSDEINLGVWVAPLLYFHDAQQCWFARGLTPRILVRKEFLVAGGGSIPLSTGFYEDGVTDSIVINGACSPSSCGQFQQVGQEGRFGFQFLMPPTKEFSASGAHPVSIMVRIGRPYSNIPKTATYGELSQEAQAFLAGLDLKGISRAFQ